MTINCVGHENSRDLMQVSWSIFGNADGIITSSILDGNIKTIIEFEEKIYTHVTKFTEKNDFKRSLCICAKQIKEFDNPWGILTGINPAKLAFENYVEQEFMEKYLVYKKRAEFCKIVADFTKSLRVNQQDLSIYINIPFCKSKCKYCSFVSNSIDTANKHMDKYIECLILEIKTCSKLLENRKIRAIYIGGGTPTALSEQNLEKLLKTIKQSFNLDYLLEYTVEAGRVDTINYEKLDILKKYNVSRISINPQIFDDEILKKIGRNHTSQDVIDIYNKARKMNFKAINMDIIYGLGGDFNKTVDTILKLNPENITMHTLAIKKGSLLSKDYMENIGDINYFYDKIFENYKLYYMYKQQYMIKPYENVGFYRNETPCLYNVYMMENLMDILALGSASTSKINKTSYFNNKYPLDYINNIEKIITNKTLMLKKENNNGI